MKKEKAKKLTEAWALKHEGLSAAEISRRIDVRRATVIVWFEQEEYQDRRGWAKGNLAGRPR